MRGQAVLEFVNREEELKYVRNCLIESVESPALIIIRAPSGYGKSSLTDQLDRFDSLSGKPFCVVDPYLRGKKAGISTYDGFFIQRIAESLDSGVGNRQCNWPTLSEYLKQHRKKTLSAKKKDDLVSELPSLKHAYKIIYDYASRAFSFGKFSPEKLLLSDESDAITICSSYVDFVLKNYVVILIVREVQHIDLHSLKVLLLACEKHPGPDVIIEYTNDNEEFEPEHHKLILHALERRPRADLLDLIQLEQPHLEYLIKRNVNSNFNLTSDYYLSWDGNLRSIIELKFKVGIGQPLLNGKLIGNTLSNLVDTVIDHISGLASIEKTILAITVANVEAIESTTLSAVISSLNQFERESEIIRALDALENKHAFIRRKSGAISIENDTIAQAVSDAPSIKGLIAIAERGLRDHYALMLGQNADSSVFFNSVRQYFSLCVRTRDIAGLMWATKHLSKEVEKSQDQSIYVDAVSAAIEDAPELYTEQHAELIEWAAELAYSTGDWHRVSLLLKLTDKTSHYSQTMLACALQEIGEHDEALNISRAIKLNSSSSTEAILASILVEVLVIGGRGEHEKARMLLNEATSNSKFLFSPLIGYAYRFYEIVDNLEFSLKNLQKSINWFAKHSYYKSMAYSQLPASMLLARKGKIGQARKLIDQATQTLAGEVKDQHLILNNSSAVELLSTKPNFNSCIYMLNQALKYARDDFSELTILVNLSLSYVGNGDFAEAEVCSDKCIQILGQHDFVDTSIYWPTCYNVSVVYKKCGKLEKSQDALEFPFKNAPKRKDDSQYWDYRFGICDSYPSSHSFLIKKEWHPQYLSHWLIDLEGLFELKAK